MKKRIMILLTLILTVISSFVIIEKPKANEKIEIAIMQKYQITKAYNDTVTWKSSKPLVASVSKSGVITGVSSGSAKITGTYKNGKKQVINVTVLKKGKTSITASDIKLSVGESRNIPVTTYPVSMKDSLTYTSSNILVAKVDATGKVTGVRDGVATITITAPNLKTKKVTVTVGTATSNTTGNGGNDGSSIFDTMIDPISITFVEPTEKSVTINTVVSIKFNLTNNDSGNYYYVWNTYTDNVQNYDGLKENGCLKLVNEKNKTVTLTMSKTNRYGEVVIYSDASCKNKITSKKTSTYTIKSSDVSASLTSNVSGTKVDKNAEVKIIGTIKNNSKGAYYYRWQDYKNGSKLGSATSCTKINKSTTINPTRTLKISSTGIKTKLEIYTDSSCSQRFKEVQSNTYGFKSSLFSSIFDLLFGSISSDNNSTGNVNITFTPSTNKTTVDYNTVISFNTKFTNTTGKDYYYKWYTYTGNTQTYEDPTCKKILNGSTANPELTINAKNRLGKFVIYSDSSCKNEYKAANTATYTYDQKVAESNAIINSTVQLSNYASLDFNGSEKFGIQGFTINNGVVYYAKTKAGASLTNFKTTIGSTPTVNSSELSNFTAFFQNNPTYKINDMATDLETGINYYLAYSSEKGKAVLLFYKNGSVHTQYFKYTLSTISYLGKDFKIKTGKKFGSLTGRKLCIFNETTNDSTISYDCVANITMPKEYKYSQGIAIMNNYLLFAYNNSNSSRIRYDNKVAVYDISKAFDKGGLFSSKPTINIKTTWDMGVCTSGNTSLACELEDLSYDGKNLYAAYNKSSFNGFTVYKVK